MLLIFAIGVPIADSIVETPGAQRLRSRDSRRRSAARRGAARHHRGRSTVSIPATPTPALQRAADVYASLRILDQHARSSAPAWCSGCSASPIGLRTLSAKFRARNQVERSSRSYCSPAPRRGADHDRHRVLGAVRDHPLLREGLAARLPVRPAMEPADRDPRRSGRLVRRLRHRAAGRRHAADHHHRDADRRADRPVRGDLHGGICHAALPRLRQADPRNPRRHSDRGARLLRGADAGALAARAAGEASGSTSPRRARSPPGSSWA